MGPEMFLCRVQWGISVTAVLNTASLTRELFLLFVRSMSSE
jgi:hypothetical protein